MAFVQLMEFRTSRFEEGKPLVDQGWKETEGKRSARRGVVGRDRNDPNHYFNIVFFDSYEAAMQNSKLPETQELSQQLAALGDGPPTFYDLEVIEDRS